MLSPSASCFRCRSCKALRDSMNHGYSSDFDFTEELIVASGSGLRSLMKEHSPGSKAPVSLAGGGVIRPPPLRAKDPRHSWDESGAATSDLSGGHRDPFSPHIGNIGCKPRPKSGAHQHTYRSTGIGGIACVRIPLLCGCLRSNRQVQTHTIESPAYSLCTIGRTQRTAFWLEPKWRTSSFCSCTNGI